MSEDSTSGFVFQLSLKNQNDMMVNLRANSEDEMKTAVSLFKKYGKAFGFNVEDPSQNKAPERKWGGGGGWKKGGTTQRSVVPVSHEGAKELGDGTYAITVGVETVYDKRPSKNNPEKESPGTVIGKNGQRYNTFDDNLLDLARDAKKRNKLVVITYEHNERFKSNDITEDGLVIAGTTRPAADTDTDTDEQSEAADGY